MLLEKWKSIKSFRSSIFIIAYWIKKKPMSSLLLENDDEFYQHNFISTSVSSLQCYSYVKLWLEFIRCTLKNKKNSSQKAVNKSPINFQSNYSPQIKMERLQKNKINYNNLPFCTSSQSILIINDGSAGLMATSINSNCQRKLNYTQKYILIT